MRPQPLILSMPIFALAFILTTQSVFSNPFSTNASDGHLIADYRFNGDGRDSSGHSLDFDLRNTTFVEGALHADGRHEHFREQYRAVATIPELEYNSFTVSMEFLPTHSVSRETILTRIFRHRIGDDSNILTAGTPSNIVTAGTPSHWFSIRRNIDDSIVVSLNHGEVRHHFTNAFVNVGVWNQIVCSVNVEGSVVRTYLNNRKLNDIPLGRTFSLRVSERKLTLTNYSYSRTFRGYVDNLRVYSPALDDDAALALAPEHPLGIWAKPNKQLWSLWVGAIAILGLVVSKILLKRQQL